MIARLRAAALAAIAALVAAATLASFAESYRGLYLWARGHGVQGIWAAAWPLQVDVFIAAGELALFIAMADRWPARSRAAAWAATAAGLAASVAGNTGHAASATPADRGTAAVPPLAAAAALAIGLSVLKRIIGPHPDASCGTDGGGLTGLEVLPGFSAAEAMFRAELDAGTVPGIRGIKRRLRCGYPAAKQVQDHLRRAAASAPAPAGTGS